MYDLIREVEQKEKEAIDAIVNWLFANKNEITTVERTLAGIARDGIVISFCPAESFRGFHLAVDVKDSNFLDGKIRHYEVSSACEESSERLNDLYFGFRERTVR
jgi:hypothetical protein